MTGVRSALAVYKDEGEALLDTLTAYAAEQGIELIPVPLDEFAEAPSAWLEQSRHVVAAVNDGDLSRIIHGARVHDYAVGIIPVSPRSLTYRLFAIPRRLEQAMELAFMAEGRAVDVVLCNDEVVLGMVMLGETPFLDQRSKGYVTEQPTRLSRLWYFIQSCFISIGNLFGIHPFPVTLTTGRDVTIKTAVTGIVLIENDVHSAAARLVNTSISVQDGKVSSVLIAPKSVVEYLAFMLTALFQGNRLGKKLPAAISYIKSETLEIASSKKMPYYVDGRRREASKLKVRVEPQSVRINLNETFYERHESAGEKKDTMKVENLPQNEARVEMIQKHLPFFTRAVEEDFKDLFLLLKNNAQTNRDYVILMVLSSLVASLGLFLNSAAVIIGAMVLAPLMAPIISMSMGALRNDTTLLRNSIFTIGVGVLLALGASALVAIIVPLQKMTPEIAGRLQPSLLDMGVAVGSGIAGAYAHARESVMKSLPGVAIAVALVPPVCVAGIGIGWLSWEVISGAMLLFITNLVGIALAGLLTFMMLGYAPVKRATKGLGWSLLMVVLVSIPLAISFNNINRHWQIENRLAVTQFEVNGKSLSLADVSLTLARDELRIRADVVSAQMLAPGDLHDLKVQLEQMLDSRVLLEAAPRLRL
ncbi:MAG: DUF389 domain-containing protein [Alcanivorax sp.]|nr:DUF389 domain-containing protein [Alcanivorax sp.]